MFEQFKRIVFKLDGGMCQIGNLCIVLNMLIVAASIVMRFVFKSPIAGLTDITGFVSALIIALTLAYTDIDNGHISVDFIMEHFPKTVQKFVYIIIGLANMAMLAVLSWQLFLYAKSTYISKTASWVIDIPFYPIVFACGLGLFMFFLTALVKYVDKIKNWEE